jgi:hypothetical protein
MAVTSTQTSNGGVANIAVGRYLSTGTAAAFKITTGFKPRYVKVVNLTAALTGLCQMEWYEGMTDAYGVKTYDAGTSETGVEMITSLGITVAEDGFTVGLDTDLNVTSEQLSWIAIG